MWISRRLFDDMRAETTVLATRSSLLAEQNKVLQTTLDWLRFRLTQVETERAQLIYNYMGVKIAVPSIEPAVKTPEAEIAGHPLHQLPDFNDMGDAMAKKLGIDWNPDGTIKYSDKATV